MTTPPRMATPLQAILVSEFAHGNSILSIGDWPPTCRLFVQLERPFRKRYPLAADIIHESGKDMRDCKTEYRTKDGSELLVCGY